MTDARNAALTALARRAHTRRELQTKLRRKGFDREEIAGALDRLTADGWLDDARAAASVVTSSAGKGRGRTRIAAELAARGVSRAEADAALSALDPDEERKALRLALEKKARALSGLTPAARSKKLFDHLVRRGFAPGAVREAIRTKGDPLDDED